MKHSQQVVAAFSDEQASSLTGITKNQLRYWDQIGFYHPSYGEDNRRIAFSRVYSFRDIVALRVLHVLRNQYNVSLQHLRDVSEKLGGSDVEKWIGVKLYVLNRKVVWIEPETELAQEVAAGQYIVPLILQTVISDTENDIRGLIRKRDQSSIGKIERSRYVVHNAPVLSGTRIPVSAIKRFAEAGYNTAQIIEEYPDLSEEDIEAALAYKGEKTAA